MPFGRAPVTVPSTGHRVLVILRDGRPDSVFALTATGGRVTRIHVVRNPEKLRGVHVRP